MLRPRNPVSSAVVTIAAVFGLAVGVSGCAKFDAALGQQWIEVTFAPDTSIAVAKHITSVCSHIPNVRLEGPVKATTAQPGVVGSVRYGDTEATDAQQALLQQCLSRFPKTVQGFTQTDEGDSG